MTGFETPIGFRPTCAAGAGLALLRALNTINLGLNYLLKGHAINWKLDVALNDRRVDGEAVSTVRLQTQILF